MHKERKRLTEAFLSLLSLMEGELPLDYINMFYHRYEEGGESWLHLFPLVTGYEREQLPQVVDWLSYINPKFFPPPETILGIDFANLSGGKGRRCTKGLIVAEE